MKHSKTKHSTPPPRMPVDDRMPLNYQYSRKDPIWVTDSKNARKYPLWVTDGPFYYNPDDPRLLVPWRDGWRKHRAINFGHPQASWLIGGMGVLLGGMTLSWVFLMHTYRHFLAGCIYFGFLLLIWLLLVGNVYALRRRSSRESDEWEEDQ